MIAGSTTGIQPAKPKVQFFRDTEFNSCEKNWQLVLKFDKSNNNSEK